MKTGVFFIRNSHFRVLNAPVLTRDCTKMRFEIISSDGVGWGESRSELSRGLSRFVVKVIAKSVKTPAK